MRPRIFLDTNVMLDFLDERQPFYIHAAQIMSLSDQKKIELIVSPISYTTIDYLLSKKNPNKLVREKLRDFKILATIGSINEQTIEKALISKFRDFEDAVQYYCALDANCETIITRDSKHFKESILPAITPKEYLASISKP